MQTRVPVELKHDRPDNRRVRSSRVRDRVPHVRDILATKRDDECVVGGETDRSRERRSWASGVTFEIETA